MSWECKGIPSDPHPTEVNEDDLSCSVCGRTLEEISGKRKPPLEKKFPVALAIIPLVLLAGGGVVATQSDKIGFVCERVGNCESYGKALKTATALSKDAEQGLKNPKSMEDLKNVDGLLTKSNKTVSSASIPANSPVFSQAKKLTDDNKKLLEKVSEITKKETDADNALKKASAKASEADKVAKPETLESKKQQKGILVSATELAKAVPDRSFVKAKKTEAIKKYEDKIALLQKDISKLEEIQFPETVAPGTTTYNEPPIDYGRPPTRNPNPPTETDQACARIPRPSNCLF